MTHEIWFWQRIISPHMAGLAAALAASGNAVRYVAEHPMSARRAAQGWTPPSTGGAKLEFAPTPDAARRLAASAPPHAVHICEGLRKNGTIAAAQAEFAQSGARWYVFIETVEDHGRTGPLKRALYGHLVRRATRQGVEGWLATGHTTPTWLIARGANPASVHPFAYFLPPATGVAHCPSGSPGVSARHAMPDFPPGRASPTSATAQSLPGLEHHASSSGVEAPPKSVMPRPASTIPPGGTAGQRHPRSALPSETGSTPPEPFHVLFAGQLIPRKAPLLLIEAFSRLPRDAARLTLIGTGPLADEIRKRAQGLNIDLPGQLPMETTRAAMAQADRLILPSRHDGWGAVVSEALISGTPVICSNRCGSAGVAQASGHGRIFPAGDPAALTAAMKTAIDAGKPHPDTRAALASWAQCLTAGAGAAHLDRILTSRSSHALRPPWQSAAPKIRATA